MYFRALAASAFIASPLLADASTRADELLKLIRDNGCQMTTAEADELLPKHNFTMDETRDIARAWAKAGLIEMNDFAGIKLSEKGCQGA
ncbi:hypothetical protein [Shimia haliotis]|uniref:Peptidase propeptide and YPEB domain-containing protein n=1 Tax=Shimia haliotis TaxID=1280847 RepID=A0A1I4FZL3_9RHOB|nr:hypothetical protein [Shimia haliotis]SFL22181.1 hypothetical protein SAMN04488036_10717 [Shimia haliotis]